MTIELIGITGSIRKNSCNTGLLRAAAELLAGKPTAIVSAAKGHVGGARAQNHLRDVFSATLTPVVPSPPFLAPEAQSKCDGATGDLTDEETRRRLSRYLEDFLCWVIKLS